MLYVAIGFLVLGLIVGGAGLRAVGRFTRRTWRPGAGVLALACFVGAAVAGVREAWPAAVGLVLVGSFLSLSVRRTGRLRHTPPREPAPPAVSLDVASAAAILGVPTTATDEEVQAAYLRLIRRTHPDQGGTAGLAAQLNAARDVMLKRRR